MSTLAEFYIKKETLEILLKTLKAKKEEGVSLTISLSDQTNDYGQNVNSWVSQSKEDREAKKERFWTGSGKVFWTDGSVSVAEKKDSPKTLTESVSEENDLPF